MASAPNLSVGRHPEREQADAAAVRVILDSQYLGHVAFTVDGWPYAVPTICARDGERLIIHGSVLSRMVGALRDGVRVCVTVTALDGVVCARSAFNHSLNYRSVMVFGVATPITGADDKLRAVRAVVEAVLPGRWDEVRPPSRAELRATEVLELPLDHLTAKVRIGGPVDTPADRRRAVWAGVLPVKQQPGAPVLVPDDLAGLPLPPSVLAALSIRAH